MAENLDSGTSEGHVNLINWDKKNQNTLCNFFKGFENVPLGLNLPSYYMF